MTWEWVALILGLVMIVATLFGYIAWTNMQIKINETYPKTLPDMMRSRQKEEPNGGT